MLELPEALNLARQINEAVAGKTVKCVLAPTKAHRFCWYNGMPADYDARLSGSMLVSAEGFGIFAQMRFSNGLLLCVNDGVNLRLVQQSEVPQNHQLAILFADGFALVFTVAMYGGIYLHNGNYDNEYYLSSRAALSPFSPEFDAYYRAALAKCKPGISAKAFLATEQRFPGIGNGVLQDILFDARIHPKRKLSTFTPDESEALLISLRRVLKSMLVQCGRDTEKDLFGKPGGYKTLMSKNSLSTGCAACGGPITKEAYLGGSVYYCPRCQRL